MRIPLVSVAGLPPTATVIVCGVSSSFTAMLPVAVVIDPPTGDEMVNVPDLLP